MEKLAERDSDTSFLVPCVHCDALIQEGERFCPFCKKDQRPSGGIPDRPGARTTSRGDASDGSQGAGWLGPRGAGFPAVAADTQPSALDEPGRTRRRPALVVAGALVALVAVVYLLVLGIDHLAGRTEEAARRQLVEATTVQLRAALDRGDLTGAARALEVLGTAQATDPDVRALKAVFDQRIAEQTLRRDRLSAAARDASRSLGFGQTGASPVAAPPAEPVPETKGSACNEALEALSLCEPG
jgi:hypothetical protein